MNSLNVSKQAFYYWLPPATMTQKNPIEKSGTYAACEQMIQMSCMTMRLSKLDEMLKWPAQPRGTPGSAGACKENLAR